MLTDEELLRALITNIEDWDFVEFNYFKIDETIGKAIAREYRRLKLRMKR